MLDGGAALVLHFRREPRELRGDLIFGIPGGAELRQEFGTLTAGPCAPRAADRPVERGDARCELDRSEEHTSELQSLMRISYAVFCLKKKTKTRIQYTRACR